MGKTILPKDLTLRVKIHIYVMGFLAALLIVLWFVQVVFFKTLYRNVKRQEIMQVATVMENVINGKESVAKLVSEVADKEACIIVYDKDMKNVQSLDGPRACVIHKMSHKEQVEAIERVLGDSSRQFLEYEQEDETYRLVTQSASSEFRIFKQDGAPKAVIYARRIIDVDGDVYTILVNAQDEPVNAIISTTQMVLTVVTLFSMVSVWALILIMAKGICDPIEQITEKAKVLAKGKYDIEFDGTGYLEINELSETMTYAANELSNLEKLRQEFIANVSHDLRTPLTMIGGYAEVMRDIPGENSPENAQVIIDETKRLSDMVSELLNISKIQSGAAKPNFIKYNLTDSIQGIIQNVAELIKGDGFKIDFIYDEEIEIVADKTLINQCFYNLLANALSYSVERKEVIVKQIREENSVRIEVTDFGKGMSPSDIPNIWERYYKDTEKRTEKVKHNGLGLSIVKTFIMVHGGKYGVESELGKGSTFWFSINIER